MKHIVSAYMLFIIGLCFLFGIPAVVLGVIFLPRHTSLAFGRLVFGTTLRVAGIKVKVRGLEQLDPDKPYIFVGNHVNMLDPFVMVALVPRPFVAIEKKENFKIPIYGWLMGRWGNIPIDRENPEKARESMISAGEVLRAKKEIVIVYAEGTRTRTGVVGPFKKGGFHLAVETGVEVVPFTQVGAFRIMAHKTWFMRPGTYELVLHPPIDPATYGRERMDDLVRDTREQVLSAYDGPRELPAAEAAAVHS
ncbi:MAG: plsC2 [Cyanobacteria bacterium RYN_339]|nr:plsC2 [Cyanobacteria bacterium RYN_339]